LIIDPIYSGGRLSSVAEFARELHERSSGNGVSDLKPLAYPSSLERVHDIKAVIFDVYGTLVNYWREEFSNTGSKEAVLLDAFKKTMDRFGFSAFLLKMNPESPPEVTLRDFYHGLIAISHQKLRENGATEPEIRIEEIWHTILLMMERHGFDHENSGAENVHELSFHVAYYYNFHSLGRGFYPGVVSALTTLRDSNLKLGVLSNAQFYTPIDLTLFVREQSNDRLDDYLEIFDTDLTFYSYQYKAAKPGQALFRKLFDALYQFRILPSQTVVVGNDLLADIKPAQEVGMKTALFTGDSRTVFHHEQGGQVIPDIVFSSFSDLPGKISFYEEKVG